MYYKPVDSEKSLPMMPMKNFNLKCFVDCINELVRCDEVERALWLCDNLPAYYRDHVPQEISDLKEEIVKKILTPISYSKSEGHAKELDEIGLANGLITLRAQIISKDVLLFNQKGYVPHIVDMGPGNYFIPRVLKTLGLKFTYNPLCLTQKTRSLAIDQISEFIDEKKPDGSRPVMFVACEVIEHLSNELEIKTNMLAFAGLADVVHISTPMYTFGFNLDGTWQEIHEELGHLRAYTPDEFRIVCSKMFRGYSGVFYPDEAMHLRLVKAGSKFSPEGALDMTREMDAIIEFRKKIIEEIESDKLNEMIEVNK